MLKDLFAFFSGYCFFTVNSEFRGTVADKVYKYGIKCYGTHVMKDGSFRLKVPLYYVSRVKRIFDYEDIEFEKSDIKGIPFYLTFLVKRPGLGIGLIIFFIIMSISANVVWTVEVEGNEKYSDAFVISQLADLGFTYGTYIPSVDFDQMHSEYLAKFSEISWISVNMNGTHARVQVREKRFGGEGKHEAGTYANIIASEDAVIKHEETVDGVPLVSQGNVVRKGELLVTGVVPLRNGGQRYTYAESKVFAYVPRSFKVEIPFKTTQKVYSGESFTKKTVKFFKKSINLSINSGFEYTTYDKIVRSRRVCIFDTIPLPIWIEETEYKEYYYADKTLTKEAAVSLARSELRDKLDEILADAELTSSNFTYAISDKRFIIKCELTCITDIAKVVEFTVDESTNVTSEEKN